MKIKDLLALEKNKERDRQWQDLIGFYLKMGWSELQLKKEKGISGNEKKVLDKAYSLFQKGWPVSYITGRCFFYKTDFLINRSVFIPRPETEILVERALTCISRKLSTTPCDDRKIRVMDIGSGSGCLGLSIARECPKIGMWLLEVDPEAIELSKKNARLLSLKNVKFQCVRVGVELFEPCEWKNQFDLIVTNPPYIAHGDPRVSLYVHDFEPHKALYAEENGLYWIHKWLEWSYDFLREDGLLILEFGQGQSQAVRSWLKKSPYKIREWIHDYSGIERFLELGK